MSAPIRHAHMMIAASRVPLQWIEPVAQLIADIEAAARLAGARAMQEAAAEEARSHSCQTWSELCDCGGHIAHDIRALVPEDVVKEADRG